MLCIGLVTRSNGESETVSDTSFDLNLEFLALQMWSSFWTFVLIKVNNFYQLHMVDHGDRHKSY